MRTPITALGLALVVALSGCGGDEASVGAGDDGEAGASQAVEDAATDDDVATDEGTSDEASPGVDGSTDDEPVAEDVDGSTDGEAGEEPADEEPAKGTSDGGGTGGLPDGTYPCAYNSGGSLYGLGALEIDGSQYGGFSGPLRGTYSVGERDTIVFVGGFSGTPDGFDIGSTRYEREPTSGSPYVEINILSPSGNVLTVTCST